eukprot:COSAG04_NODE_2599_length_3870_cov_4.599045_2_plen_112_part_00
MHSGMVAPVDEVRLNLSEQPRLASDRFVDDGFTLSEVVSTVVAHDSGSAAPACGLRIMNRNRAIRHGSGANRSCSAKRARGGEALASRVITAHLQSPIKVEASNRPPAAWY